MFEIPHKLKSKNNDIKIKNIIFMTLLRDRILNKLLKIVHIKATLILEEFSMDTIVKHIKNNIFKDIHNIQTAPTQVISPLYRTTPDYSLTVLK